MEKKITDAAIKDLGIDVEWARTRQRYAIEAEERIRLVHSTVADLEERRAAIAVIHSEHKAKLAALKHP